jgi:integral membrane protein
MRLGGGRYGRRTVELVPRGLLVRYRIMALTTATLLIVLVFVGIPLQVAAGEPGVASVVGTVHGFLYIVYLLAAFQLTRRLGVPKWQMLLVLLAGTLPFCGFVAERKMTRRFDALVPRAPEQCGGAARRLRPSAMARQRWLSARALLLHVEVLAVAPGCALAGWWQATRALAGNELSWVYSVEWPIFALLAILGWWHLVHEDPEAYRARRWRSKEPRAPVPSVSMLPVDVEPQTAAWAAALAAGVVVELLTGCLSLALVPMGRPSGWVPDHGAPAYGAHASVGVALGLGAIVFALATRRFGRIARISGWSGAACIALAGIGGLMTESHSIMRVLGIVVMFVGTALAGSAYLAPIVLRTRGHTVARSPVGSEHSTGGVPSGPTPAHADQRRV